MDSADTKNNLLKKIIIRRAKELGSDIGPQDVTVNYWDAEVAQGCILFHAFWGAGDDRQSLAGLIRDEEEPDTFPAQALGKIFYRWLETERKLPEPKRIAEVAAYLYDPSGLHCPILSEEDKSRFASRPDWSPFIALPKLIDVDGQPAITFWRVGPYGASEIRFVLSKEGRIQTKEVFIQELIEQFKA